MIAKALNHYKTLEKLGSGGMGEVYLAEDTRLHRKIALKVLPADMAVDEERRGRFEREVQIVSQEPDLVLVHRSGFFHAMNQEFGFGYPDDGAVFDEVAARRLYELSDNKLVAVLGFLGRDNPRTRFLVYSRGTGGGWTDDQYRAEWVHKVEGRFPFLKGRVGTVNVPGGPGGGSFDDADTRQLFRRQVRDLLGLGAAEPVAK